MPPEPRRLLAALGQFGLHLRREAARASFLHGAVWGVLGAPRLHRTVLEGDIISKEEAGEYGLAAFGDRWRPMIDEALAYWRGELAAGPFRPAGCRRRDAARFVLEVVESATAAVTPALSCGSAPPRS